MVGMLLKSFLYAGTISVELDLQSLQHLHKRNCQQTLGRDGRRRPLQSGRVFKDGQTLFGGVLAPSPVRVQKFHPLASSCCLQNFRCRKRFNKFPCVGTRPIVKRLQRSRIVVS